MTEFTDTSPNLETYWRSIILFGRNVASYKFALAKSLLEIGAAENEMIRLEDLAEPFSRNVCEHLKNSPKQTTSKSSKFLEACGTYNAGDLSHSVLIARTTQLGFVNVIDAFHVVNQSEIPKRFFLDERKESSGIRLTEDFFRMAEVNQVTGFDHEVEARWRLVETAWQLGLSRNLTAIEHDSELNLFVTGRADRRVSVTSSRDALNGYQKGRCFYCFDQISILEGDTALADVDHFFPHVLKLEMPDAQLDGIWNLVLACKTCNRGHDGKFARLPDTNLLSRLHTRNEFLIGSHHPLRETLMSQAGNTRTERKNFLQMQYKRARDLLIHKWQPMLRADPVF
jgi:5-methylcytosine-specific restriction endonuclease McrA